MTGNRVDVTFGRLTEGVRINSRPRAKRLTGCVQINQYPMNSREESTRRGVKFGNFLGSKITAVKTDLPECTLLDQFLLQ